MADDDESPLKLLDPKTIGQLAQVMKEHDLSECDLRWGKAQVRLRRGEKTPAAPIAAAATTVASAPAVSAPSPTMAPAEPVQPPPSAAPLKNVTSPIVGTFYASANPNSEPFVRVGSRVEPDTTVCIVEAMKVFNEIPAGVSGTIREILVENGSPVEYGQVLFRVAP